MAACVGPSGASSIAPRKAAAIAPGGQRPGSPVSDRLARARRHLSARSTPQQVRVGARGTSALRALVGAPLHHRNRHSDPSPPHPPVRAGPRALVGATVACGGARGQEGGRAVAGCKTAPALPAAVRDRRLPRRRSARETVSRRHAVRGPAPGRSPEPLAYSPDFIRGARLRSPHPLSRWQPRIRSGSTRPQARAPAGNIRCKGGCSGQRPERSEGCP